MNYDKLSHFFQTKTFKRIYFGLFLVLLIVGVFIAISPDRFLKSGYVGIFFFNVLGGLGTYLVPSLSLKMNLVLISLSTALGMAVNDSISFVVGRGGTAIIPQGKWTKRAEKVIERFGWVALFFISLVPFPYDIIGLIAGYLGIPYTKFFLPTFAGKFLRMILIGLGFKELMMLL